jgi:hypothetical protein
MKSSATKSRVRKYMDSWSERSMRRTRNATSSLSRPCMIKMFRMASKRASSTTFQFTMAFQNSTAQAQSQRPVAKPRWTRLPMHSMVFLRQPKGTCAHHKLAGWSCAQEYPGCPDVQTLLAPQPLRRLGGGTMGNLCARLEYCLHCADGDGRRCQWKKREYNGA